MEAGSQLIGSVELRPDLIGLPSRAAWIPSERALLIADVHLAFSAVERRRGTSGPGIDAHTGVSLQRLVDAHAPSIVVLVGDIAHAAPKTEQEFAAIVDPLDTIAARAELRLIIGNHDRGLERVLPPTLSRHCSTELDIAGFRLTHGDKELSSERTSVLGHYHPAVALPGPTGAPTRFPAFLVGSKAVVLPAFSPVSAGLNALGTRFEDIANRMSLGDPSVFACTPTQVRSLGKLGRLRDYVGRL
jgi:putative SbcD/Mre11-related phosphoesterase